MDEPTQPDNDANSSRLEHDHSREAIAERLAVEGDHGVLGDFVLGAVDGTITTQPEFSFWFEDVGWGVENYGTDPDIEVEIKPQDYRAGRDPQRKRAVQEVLKLIRKRKPRVPDFEPAPSRVPPRLPGPGS